MGIYVEYMRVFWRRDCGKNVNKTKNILMTKPNVRKQSQHATEPPIPGPNRYPKSRFQSKPPCWTTGVGTQNRKGQRRPIMCARPVIICIKIYMQRSKQNSLAINYENTLNSQVRGRMWMCEADGWEGVLQTWASDTEAALRRMGVTGGHFPHSKPKTDVRQMPLSPRFGSALFTLGSRPTNAQIHTYAPPPYSVYLLSCDT